MMERSKHITIAGAGLVGSLIVGLIASNFTILGGLRLAAIAAALAGAAIAVAGLHFYQQRNSRD